MNDFNLLVTFHQYERTRAEDEVRQRLKEGGAHLEKLEQSELEGIFLAQIIGDAKKVVKVLRSTCQESPELFLHTHHWVPIDRWVATEEEEMARAAEQLAKGIGKNEKWMMHLHKRHSEKHTANLIEKLTAHIENGLVDLKHPDKIVVVEILGKIAGLALVRSDELLDVGKIRTEIEL